MANPSEHHTVIITRARQGLFTVANTRGGQVTLGVGSGTELTPAELLLAAIGGCTAIDVDILTSRLAETDSFRVRVDADKVRDSGGNRLTDIEVTFQITFPANSHGDQARAILPDAVKQSHDRLCTIGHTVEAGTPITTKID